MKGVQSCKYYSPDHRDCFQKARSWAYNRRASSSGVFEMEFPGTSVALFVAWIASVDGVMAIGLMKKKNSLPFNSPWSGVEEKVLWFNQP